MIRPAGFLGLYADLALVVLERASTGRRESFTEMKLTFPTRGFTPILEQLRGPPGDPETGPNVLVIPTSVPRRPDDAANVMADAALRLLEHLVETRAIRFDPGLARRFEALADIVPFHPLHIALWSNEERAS